MHVHHGNDWVGAADASLGCEAHRPSGLGVRVLGAVELSWCGSSVHIGGMTQRRILAALTMYAGHVLPVDRLVDIIWSSEQCSETSAQNVRSYVYRLRSALDEGAAERLATRSPGYVLTVHPDEIDATRFDGEVNLARSHLGAARPVQAAECAEKALALWRGRPYSEFADETWARAEVARLEERHVEVLELRCEALLESGRAHEALAALAALIEEHPLRESPRRLQMIALYRTGRQVDALRAFQRFRNLLIEEVGVSPSREVVALDGAIAAADSSRVAVHTGKTLVAPGP